MPDGYRALEPPDTISNSEVKRCIADGSMGSPHVRVGHYQALFFLPKFFYIFLILRVVLTSAVFNNLVTCIIAPQQTLNHDT